MYEKGVWAEMLSDRKFPDCQRQRVCLRCPKWPEFPDCAAVMQEGVDLTNTLVGIVQSLRRSAEGPTRGRFM